MKNKKAIFVRLVLFRCTFLSLLLVSILSGAYTQVTIAPTAIHLSNNNLTDRIIVLNNSNFDAQEVELDARFGYPASDEQGNVSIYYPEVISVDDPNASDWVFFYPRRFILQPGERQTVRIAVRPPADLSVGEYWARPVIISTPVKRPAPAAEAGKSDVLRAGLSTQINTVIALNYRHGNVNTGVEIAGFTESVEEDDLSVRVDMTRKGNAAFLGNLILRIRDSNNRVVDEARRDVAVYYDLTRVFTFPRKDLQSGIYTAEVELNTDRRLTGGSILPATPVRKFVRIKVP